MKTNSEALIDRHELIVYINSLLPRSVHMSLGLSKDSYTQEEANEILAQALETWEYIKNLKK